MTHDHESARRVVEDVLGLAGATGVEVVVSSSRTGLTRFANSEVIQNTVRDELRAYVRVVAGARMSVATTNQLDAEHLDRTARAALQGAFASPEDEGFPGLPDPNDVGAPDPVRRFDVATEAASPDDRAAEVRKVLAVAGSSSVAGVYETSSHGFSVFSSRGVDCHDAFTRCVVTCLADTGEATGWGESTSHARDLVDVEQAARRALEKAERGKGARTGNPGSFRVVLEPPATALLIEYLAYTGFGAKAVIDGESFLSEKTGVEVAAPMVTVADDARHPGSLGIGFDFEGVPRQRVAVIENGCATGPVTDLRTAKELGTKLTGHYSGSGEVGPWASHLVMEPGPESTEDLIAGVDEGYLVTRFHYVNVLDRPQTLLTGMTRDGTFRISNGEIAEPVHNFRFAQSALAALAATDGVGSELWTFGPDYGSFGSTVAPAVRLGDFHFASTTSH